MERANDPCLVGAHTGSGPHLPRHSPYGPRAGFVRVRAGSLGWPGRAPVKSCSNPSQLPVRCPDWARTGLTGLARSNPGRARYLGRVSSTQKISHAHMGRTFTHKKPSSFETLGSQFFCTRRCDKLGLWAEPKSRVL